MSSFLTSDGIRLAYAVSGEGAPLLLLNGMFGDAAFWEPVSARLEGRRRCVRLDHRGVGASERWVGDYSYRLWARDAVELLDHLGIASCPALGLCHGGMTAAVMALESPGRLTGCVCHGTRLLESAKARVYDRFRADLMEAMGVEMTMAAQMGTIFGEAALAPIEPYLGKMCRTAPDRMEARSAARMLRALADFHLRPEELAGLRLPILFLAGEEDQYTPPWMVRRTARAVPGAEYLELEGIAHIPPREAPELLAELTLDFLGRHAL